MKTTSSFRAPDELRERMRRQADAERRSFSNQVRVLIEQALQVREREVAAQMERLPDPAELEWR